jgi:hypothetical protein
MCVDYRKFNDLTRKDRTPLPRIDELLDSLYGDPYLSTLNMYNKGYHQVRIKERDMHKTSFRTQYGLFEYYPQFGWLTCDPYRDSPQSGC